MLITEQRSKKRLKPSKCRLLWFVHSKLAIAWHAIALAHLVKMVLSGTVDYCYSDIGCFPLSSEFFHPQHRPINLRPWHRDLIKTQFELFNKDHPEGYMLLPWNKLNLLRSGFDARLETKIIVPGWLDNITRSHWLRKLRDALLWRWTPANIIVVRWRNFTPYTLATANTRVVGAELANLLKFIEAEMNYDRAYYHIIGHSLGAHVAGYCGDRVYGLGRITALDPARPFFQGMPKSVRLDRSDAKFIDAIHSDFTPENAFFILMSYGMSTPVGHLDFYPNGPPLFQPGCLRDTLTSVQDGIAKGLQHNSLSTAFLEAMRYLTACDHQRSHEWFIESITNRECAFVGVRCNEFEGMINGRCTCDDSPSACAIMGIHADQMYLNNVHEELWPVRAGSIHYKYNSARPAAFWPGLESWPPAHPLAAQSAATPLDHQHLEGLAHDEHGSPWLAHAGSALGSKEQIYAQLRQQASRLQRPPEPSAALVSAQHAQAHELAEPTLASYQDEPPPPPPPLHLDAEHLDVQASELERQVAVLDDMAFVQYLRVNLLATQLESVSRARAEQQTNGTAPSGGGSFEARAHQPAVRRMESESSDMSERSGWRVPPRDHPAQYDGHPLLLSNLKRDIESWYEDNSKWFLKTSDRPKYCTNQYQLMIFLGPLSSRRGRDSLRANLLVSIVGSRGQLLNQRFVPRGSSLNSFTMQPFFILLEGSYSLGQITSVSLSWEARSEPDPVQATVSFQSNLLETLGSRVPAYQAKNNPWLPEGHKYDKTQGFRFRQRQHTKAAGHYSDQYKRLDAQKVAAKKGFGRRSEHADQHFRGQWRTASDTNGWPSASKQCGQMLEPSPAGLKRNSGSSERFQMERALCSAEANQAVDYDHDHDEPDELEQAAEHERDNRLSAAVAEQLLASASIRTANSMLSQMASQPVFEEPRLVREMDGARPMEAMFVPLVDLPHPAAQRIPAGAAALADLEPNANDKLTLDLHNIDLHSDSHGEDSIVINQVIVSPMQAYYGQHGRNSKTFCPARHKRKLLQHKTVRLRAALTGKC